MPPTTSTRPSASRVWPAQKRLLGGSTRVPVWVAGSQRYAAVEVVPLRPIERIFPVGSITAWIETTGTWNGAAHWPTCSGGPVAWAFWRPLVVFLGVHVMVRSSMRISACSRACSRPRVRVSMRRRRCSLRFCTLVWRRQRCTLTGTGFLRLLSAAGVSACAEAGAGEARAMASRARAASATDAATRPSRARVSRSIVTLGLGGQVVRRRRRYITPPRIPSTTSA